MARARSEACIKGLHLPGATSSPSSRGVNVNGLIMTNGSSGSPFFSLSLSLSLCRFLDAWTVEIFTTVPGEREYALCRTARQEGNARDEKTEGEERERRSIFCRIVDTVA